MDDVHISAYEPCSAQVSDEDCGRPSVYFMDVLVNEDETNETVRVFRCKEHIKRPLPERWVVQRDGVVMRKVS